MKKGDVLWALALGIVAMIVINPSTHESFILFTNAHPYIAAFIKFSILATMGEWVAVRISSKCWIIPKGVLYRTLIWGFLGIFITLMFQIFLAGVKSGISNGYLPGGESKFAIAFFVSCIMNLTFAPVFMAFHRYTDTYIDLRYNGRRNIAVTDVVSEMDWNGFVSFVLIKTIPFFWIPAHTITFLLPSEYRVLFAAMLSLALGVILAFGKRKQKEVKGV